MAENRIEDGGLYTIGTYDPATGTTTLNTNTLNITSTTYKIGGTTGFSGTFSNGLTASNIRIITVANGIITNVA